MCSFSYSVNCEHEITLCLNKYEFEFAKYKNLYIDLTSDDEDSSDGEECCPFGCSSAYKENLRSIYCKLESSTKISCEIYYSIKDTINSTEHAKKLYSAIDSTSINFVVRGPRSKFELLKDHLSKQVVSITFEVNNDCGKIVQIFHKMNLCVYCDKEDNDLYESRGNVKSFLVKLNLKGKDHAQEADPFGVYLEIIEKILAINSIYYK